MQHQTPPHYGRELMVQPANPAAGADLSTLVPTNALWQIQSVQLLLTTAVAAANRQIHLQFTRAGGGTIRFPQQFIQVASLAVTYNWCNGFTDINNSPAGHVPCPFAFGFFLQDTDIITTVTASIQAADQISGINIWVLEWLIIG